MTYERRYRKPPVIEALCEILFAGSAWDETVPGLFYERIKTDFPTKRKREVQELGVAFGLGEAKAGIRRLPPRMQFVSEKNNRLLQIAPDLLVVNQLSPYPHFMDWEPETGRALRIYHELAQPKRVVRLGLRYINRAVIPEERLLMEDYFTIYPKLPSKISDRHGSFMFRVEIPQSEQDHVLLLTFSSAPTPASNAGQACQAFMLDYYDMLQIDKPAEGIDLLKEIRQAHENIITAFEESITDRLRGLFEPEGEPC